MVNKERTGRAEGEMKRALRRKWLMVFLVRARGEVLPVREKREAQGGGGRRRRGPGLERIGATFSGR